MCHESFLPAWVLNTPNHGAELSFVNNVSGNHNYPAVEVESMHLDALLARLVREPARFDVIVASNLFGDLLTDLSAALMGSIGIAPSANVAPDGGPSLFEPVHGSAPDIAGHGIANPIGQVWTAAMLLDHLGYASAAERIMT
ncbi:MAG TPA: isocitrate/isopropylmalate family dehydrogenase, partial [Vitreimonas sp.]|nr:isocitrate/isopropylmalate family dehydrogenase [Vitreimonas sp.]